VGIGWGWGISFAGATSVTSKYAFLYDQFEKKTYVFDVSTNEGKLLGAFEGFYQYWNDVYAIERGYYDDIGDEILRLSDFTVFSFGELIAVNSHAAIAQDENNIFYGLFTDISGLAYSTEYTKIEHNSETNIFTLEKGATPTRVWIGPNGHCFELD
jgi:hypothetical protein